MTRRRFLQQLMTWSAIIAQSPFGTLANARSSPDGFLAASGTVLRDNHGKGNVVQLRGVNLGGWLEWQSWMCPFNTEGFDQVKDLNQGHNGYDFGIWKLLSDRFNAKVANRLIRAYEDSWISQTDLDNIQKLRFNAVRLTFAYDTLKNRDGSWRDDAFACMDWLVENAWKRGIYTILDFHSWLPPGANQNGSTDGYWANPSEMSETVSIWRKIASHYRGNPAVAMYDLLNEPNNSIAKQGQLAPSTQAVQALYDRIYHAIREVDPDHIIAMEGVWGWDTLRDPSKARYGNVVYSFHWYDWWSRDTASRKAFIDANVAQFTTKYRDWNTPCYVGEFNLFGDEAAWRYAINSMDKAGISWTIWTYKCTESGDNSWGVYTTNPGKTPPIPNLVRDSASEIEAKWSAWKTDGGGFALNPLFKRVFSGGN